MIKILLVEDDLGLSNSVFDFLDDFADVMQVFDGEEGLYEAESGVYDLIARIRLLTCRPIGQICYRTRIITKVFKIFINRRIKAGAHNLNNNQGHG